MRTKRDVQDENENDTLRNYFRDECSTRNSKEYRGIKADFICFWNYIWRTLRAREYNFRMINFDTASVPRCAKGDFIDECKKQL